MNSKLGEILRFLVGASLFMLVILAIPDMALASDSITKTVFEWLSFPYRGAIIIFAIYIGALIIFAEYVGYVTAKPETKESETEPENISIDKS
jgi:hypothetical protein